MVTYSQPESKNSQTEHADLPIPYEVADIVQQLVAFKDQQIPVTANLQSSGNTLVATSTGLINSGKYVKPTVTAMVASVCRLLSAKGAHPQSANVEMGQLGAAKEVFENTLDMLGLQTSFTQTDSTDNTKQNSAADECEVSLAISGQLPDGVTPVPDGWQMEGQAIYLLGESDDELGGTMWQRIFAPETAESAGAENTAAAESARTENTAAAESASAENTTAPQKTLAPKATDLPEEAALIRVLLALAGNGVLHSAYSLGAGGLAAAILDSCGAAKIGATLDLGGVCSNWRFGTVQALFNEHPARCLISVPEGLGPAVMAAAEAEEVACLRIGTTGGQLLIMNGAAKANPAGGEPLEGDLLVVPLQ